MGELDDKKDSNGNIHIKGNLYVTDKYDDKSLSNDGIIIYAKDCFFHSNEEDITLMDNDVFIENLFEKIKVINIVIY